MKIIAQWGEFKDDYLATVLSFVLSPRKRPINIKIEDENDDSKSIEPIVNNDQLVYTGPMVKLQFKTKQKNVTYDR